jgi:hypothetical protein
VKRQVVIRVELPIAVTIAFAGAEVRFGLWDESNSLISYETALVVPAGCKVSGQTTKLVAELQSSNAAAPGTQIVRKIVPYVVDPTTTRSVTLASGSASVADPGITAADQGRPFLCNGVAAGSYVGTVTAGTGFKISSSPTAQIDVISTGDGAQTGTFKSIIAAVQLAPQVSGHLTVTATRTSEADL